MLSFLRLASRGILRSFLFLGVIGFFFAANVLADDTHNPGDIFYHSYRITNTGNCNVSITNLTKSWSSPNGAVTQVNPRSGVFSAQPTGSLAYALTPAYTLSPGESVDAPVNFWTNPAITFDVVSSSIHVEYGPIPAGCEVNLATDSSWSSTIGSGRCADADSNGIFDACIVSGTGPVCTLATFNADCIANVQACNPINQTCVLGGTGGACMVNADCQGGPGGGTVCGNGILEAGEVCDDGNTTSGDGCSAACQNEGGGGGGGGGGPGGGGGGAETPLTTGGDACGLPLICVESTVSANGELPTFQPINGKISLALSNGTCQDPNEICVQVRNAPIVAGYKNEPPNEWSACLPHPTINDGRLEVAVQSKNYYQVRVGTYIHTHDPIPGTNDYTDTRTNQTRAFGVCYFDTRIPPIETVGSNCSNSLGSVADTGQSCNNYYSEARSLMNPGIARIIEPFEKSGLCRASACGPLCCCDATGAGARLTSLDPNSNYIAPDGSTRPLSECYNDVQDVVCFDPSGGSVTLDAPGDDFVLPDRPVTLIVKGADLRIPDNLVYSNDPKSSFGVVLLKNSYCPQYGGDGFISPKPTNLVGAYYLEGSLKTTDSAWHLPTNRNNASWFYTLRNQLYLAGTLISRNTIGGAEDPTWPRFGQPKCPSSITSGFVNCSWAEAVKYDLAYLREYFSCLNPSSATDYGAGWNPTSCGAAGDIVGGGLTARDVPSDKAIVIKYDGRIQSNPPPGFETIATFLQKELGL